LIESDYEAASNVMGNLTYGWNLPEADAVGDRIALDGEGRLGIGIYSFRYSRASGYTVDINVINRDGTALDTKLHFKKVSPQDGLTRGTPLGHGVQWA
jgi:hypothetical protein